MEMYEIVIVFNELEDKFRSLYLLNALACHFYTTSRLYDDWTEFRVKCHDVILAHRFFIHSPRIANMRSIRYISPGSGYMQVLDLTARSRSSVQIMRGRL